MINNLPTLQTNDAKKNHLKSNIIGVREIVIKEYGKELIEYGMEKGKAFLSFIIDFARECLYLQNGS